jgi:hypothetical protein
MILSRSSRLAQSDKIKDAILPRLALLDIVFGASEHCFTRKPDPKSAQ